jgi:FMN phosphatase YigB (HAD superfamily)
MPDTLIPVFDIGNVFIQWDPMFLFRKLFASEEEARWFHEHVCTSAWNLEFDAGGIYADGIARLVTRFPRFWREIQAYDQRWDEMFGPFFKGTIAIHDELIGAGLKTYAITNFSWEKWFSCLPHWPFLEKFDGVVVSGLEHLVKPDQRIFRRFCERFALEPQACVFIDDSEINVVAARGVGMTAVHFTSPERLRTELIGLGLPLGG